MRNWYKYAIDSNQKSENTLPLDNSHTEHFISLGGFNTDGSYETKEAFYNKYFFNYHQGRLEHYDNFLRKYLTKNQTILSIASGRSANELRLLDDGFDVYCSDIYQFSWINETKKLWPNYQFFLLDISKNPSAQQYDTLIVLSLIYLFDEEQLDEFFKNVFQSLNKQGYLILDSAGSPDNLGSYFIHDILVKIEIYLISIVKSLAGLGKKRFRVIKKHHGYRRTNDEIKKIAEKNGFSIVLEVENYAFLTEFRRSRTLSLIIKIPFMEPFFRLLGIKIPYVRMFLFKKI